MTKYKCTCVSGGGTKQISFWGIKITPKTMKLECTDINDIWGSAERGQKFTVSLNNKNRKHSLRVWEEDLSDFTLYPNQEGTPYHFETM